MSLMYNSKIERPVTFNQLEAVATPQPQGRWHRPVSFYEYAGSIRNAVELNGFEVVNDEYAVRNDDQRMFGLMEVAPMQGEYISARDWSMQIGVRGSHDQRMARGLTFGSSVLVCSNMCFHGELGTIHTKQTTNINDRLPGMIQAAVAQLPGAAQRNQDRFDAYRGYDLKPRWGDAALVELHRRQALSGAQLSRAITEWDTPSHEDHAEDGHTAWRLLNAATEALKPAGEHGGNMDTIRDRSQRVSSFIDEVVGF